MKSRAELIEISGVLDTQAAYSPFYEFAITYLQGMKECGKKETIDFFNAIKTLGNNADSEINRNAMGITGKSTQNAKKWCNYILQAKELKELSLRELQYVIGYCARRAKIKKGSV